MVSRLTLLGQNFSRKLLLLQGVLFGVLFVVNYALNPSFEGSFLIGGGICLISHTVFSFFSFKYSGAQAAKKIMQMFFLGEALKILITSVLFVIVYVYIPVNISSLLSGYLLALATVICVPMFVQNTK